MFRECHYILRVRILMCYVASEKYFTQRLIDDFPHILSSEMSADFIISTTILHTTFDREKIDRRTTVVIKNYFELCNPTDW